MDQSIFYVDVENMQDIAKEALTEAMKSWPEDFPKPAVIKLYARADQTEMWKIWTSHRFPSVEVLVKGVQHFTNTGSKNSADISLALDAIIDVFKGRTRYIAVLSDDSDFTNLFSAIKQENCTSENPKVPFRWFMTNRLDTRSSMLTDFFPSDYIQTVNCASSPTPPKEPKSGTATPILVRTTPAKVATTATAKPKKTSTAKNKLPDVEAIARAIIKDVPVGSFKSSDCQTIVKKHFPAHPLVKADKALFGNQFSSYIWPILEISGVKLGKSSRGARKYEMTEEAKKKAGEIKL